MQLSDDALVLSALPHGEHGAVVRFLGFGHGLLDGYVSGARSKKRRAILQPGNRVALRLTRRGGQLGSATVELVKSRAALAFGRGAAPLLVWATRLTAASLAERVAEPRVAEALDNLLAGVAHGLTGEESAIALARYELLLLRETGHGLDLSSCALGGPADGLTHVSPRTGHAVSAERAGPWRPRLLPLPQLFGGAEPLADEAGAALRLTGHFLARQHAGRPQLLALRPPAVERLLAFQTRHQPLLTKAP